MAPRKNKPREAPPKKGGRPPRRPAEVPELPRVDWRAAARVVHGDGPVADAVIRMIAQIEAAVEPHIGLARAGSPTSLRAVTEAARTQAKLLGLYRAEDGKKKDGDKDPNDKADAADWISHGSDDVDIDAALQVQMEEELSDG